MLLDERSFVFDEQHRVTRTERMIYRVDSPDGVENWVRARASGSPGTRRAQSSVRASSPPTAASTSSTRTCSPMPAPREWQSRL
jgi:hypothetical protein